MIFSYVCVILCAHLLPYLTFSTNQTVFSFWPSFLGYYMPCVCYTNHVNLIANYKVMIPKLCFYKIMLF